MTPAIRHSCIPLTRGISTVLLAGVLLLGLAACESRPNISPIPQRTPERSKELLILAAGEAGLIEDLNIRLTRQLNIASLQIAAGDSRPGVTTLQTALATLNLPQAAKVMNDHTRMSGYVSVSELARRAGDKVVASTACDAAEATLRAIALPADRCQYVMGLANEFNHLRGETAAGSLLVEGAKWAKEVDSADERRKAVFAFAVALFNMNQYDQGLAALKNEPDAAWRADKLVELSRPAVSWAGYGAPTAGDPSAIELQRERAIPQQLFYGKSLEFQTNFQGAQSPRSMPQPQQPPDKK